MDADTESVSSSGVDGGSSIITNDSGGGGGGSGGSLLPAEVGSATRTKPAFVTVRIRIPDLNPYLKNFKRASTTDSFYPPSNGKAGKFLDEERRLSEYPFQGSVGYLELKYKRRVYKMLQMDEKQLKTINSRANHKKIVDYINSSNIEKVNKMLIKGLDPNFHCHDSGETPLCLAAGIKGKTSRLIIALINGGAILDFRTKDGTTALHRAVTKNNSESVKTLLDLGASPNYKDGRGLTPLYHAVASSSDVNLVEMLLHDHAMVGVQDRQEWHEVHHHLEHLLFYSADINARNASGNTPLHVCAVNNQESCARILLFRGCETEALNFAGQTPYQVAVIAGNLELAEIIRNHKAEDIVPFKNAPKFNPRRRTSASSTLSRTASDASMCQTNTTTMSTLPYQPRMESPLVNSLRTGSMNNKPPSPSPSDRSLPPFSSGGSSHQENNHEVEDEQLDSASTLAASMANDPRCDSVSLSSGVGTSSQSGSSGSAATPTSEPPKATVLHSGMHVVCVETYVSSEEGSLKINAGDVIQVTGSTDDGRLEGMIRGQSGYFPASCAQEVRLRNPDAVHSPPITSTPAPGSRVLGRRELRENRPYQFLNNRFMGLEPRTAILHKGKKGFGFVLRGAKAASPLMEIIPSEKCPGLQYMDDVDPEGVADMAGIKKGDFLIAINGDDVTQASHETVVNLIRKSGDSVALTIVTINIDHIREMEYSNGGFPRGRSMVAPPPPPKRDPSTTLSVGRAKARSMVANLAALEVLDRAINEHDSNSIEK
ncbi:SHANK [Lepeophtheirus salmonis]|uniref:SHANK n=1 Tax=Lepeophtheirus salmonis TaxID=72036 RepID=A0A7R8CY48_LEPSM|nr:SHANK [Lepeophtheirus salmonis]CAF2938589.1 SHANK [Lepeophtheirus salmonis]